MSLNEPLPNPFTETLPTALPYLPPQMPPLGEPVPSEGNSIMVEPARVAPHHPPRTKNTRRPSLTRITIAVFTLGLSTPFLGIRRQHTTRYYK